MTVAQKLHLRLFLEGVEVPVISAVVQSAPNAPAAASIQIPANDLALALRPRTLVHLFFYDFYRGAPPSDRAWVQGEGISVDSRERDPDLEGLIPPERFTATDAQQEIDLENQNYRLLFGGEVVGVNVDKAPNSRSITLQCLDWSMYWDYAFQYQVSAYSLGGGGIRAAFTGASTTLFNSFLDGNADIIAGLMATPPRNYPLLQGTLLGAITHIIEAIGGVNFGQRSIRGVNDFFSIAELRLKITQMLGANPFEQQNERRLMSANGFGSLFRRSLSGLGQQVSVRAVLNALQRYVFHEVVPITSPHFIPAQVDPNLPQYREAPITENAAYAGVLRAARQVKDRALEIKTRQEASTDDDISQRQSARRGGLALELSRLITLCARYAGISRRIATAEHSQFLNGVSVHQAFTVSVTCFQRIKEQTRRGQRTTTRTNMFYPPSTVEGQQVARLAQQVADEMERVLTATARQRVNIGNLQADPPARLLTQIYRPDVWMVAPPRCNVVFPELYTTFSYGRSFMDEVTRLMLRTHEAFYGSDILFDGFYMAPSRVLGARTGQRQARGRIGVEPPDLSDAPAWFVRDLMDHELYTGIIPKFERMSDLNLHALRGGSIEVQPSEGGPAVRVGYAQLAANHIFFKYRFMSRQLTYQGKFNPFFALGFPALIIDKYKAGELDDAEAEINNDIARRIAQRAREGEGVNVGDGTPAEVAREREMEQFRYDELYQELAAAPANSHYLGTPASVAHSISAETGGNTAVQMSYARVSDERTEFLGDDRAAPSRYTRVRNIEVNTTVGMAQEPVVGPDSRGPRGGAVVSFTDVTQEFERANPVRRVRGRRGTSATGQARYTSTTRLPLFIPGGRTARRYGTRVLIGTAVPVSSVPEIAARAGSIGGVQSGYVTSSSEQVNPTLTEETVTFRAYRIVESMGVYRRTTVDLPAEDLTFPPWYGEHYRSGNIGALYSFFFGTGSIVDPLTVIGPSGQSFSQADGGDPSGASSVTPAGTGPGGSTESGVSEGVTTPEDPTPVGVSESHAETVGPPGAVTSTPQTLNKQNEGVTIEEAVNTLVDTYSQIRRNRFDVDDFLRSYTWRPIASMVDIFGTSNLEIDDDGEVVQGVEGFHSRAFGDFDDLRQLTRTVDGQRVATVLGMTTTDVDEADGAAATQAQRDTERARRLDTRKEKRIAVYRYLQALLASRGILG